MAQHTAPADANQLGHVAVAAVVVGSAVSWCDKFGSSLGESGRGAGSLLLFKSGS